MRALIVYLIRNTANGKVYVGKTINSLEARWKEHIKDSKTRTNRHISNAIRKYGKRRFELRVLTPNCVTSGHADSIESYWIRRLRSSNRLHGYNMTRGGDGAPIGNKYRLGKLHSEETKKKISRNRTGKGRGGKGGFSGHKHSLKSRRKMSRHQMGHPFHGKRSASC